MLTAEQLRAARALKRWDQVDLAERSGVSVETIKRLEKMNGRLTATRVATLDLLRSTYEEEGVLFLDDGETVDGGPGVRLRKGE